MLTEVNGNKYAHKPKMTKEDVATELLRLQAEGHSMKTPDFEPWFYRRVVDAYGSYKAAKSELGIEINRKKTDYKMTEARRRADELRLKYTEETLIYEASKFRDKYTYITEVYANEKAILAAIGRRYGNLGVFAEKYNITLPGKRGPIRWSDENIKRELCRISRESQNISANYLKNNGYKGLVGAVSHKYGSWNAGLVALGYEVAYSTPKADWTREEAKLLAHNEIINGAPPTLSALSEKVRGLGSYIGKEFGGIANFLDYCEICPLTDKPKTAEVRKYRPDYRTVEGIQREIHRLWYIGLPMNYNFIKKKRGSLLSAANARIGSWRQAVESVGISYADITKASDTNVLSECGTEFETLFSEILTELGYEYIREGAGVADIVDDFTVKPDFILPNWRWIDCKLSEWTDASEMLKKYQPMNPNGITIVYLRGKNHRKLRGSKWKYEHISVYKFTEQLTQDRRRHYESKLKEIERKADEGAIAN